jgi:isoleucyl-tRNA synthetase
LPANQAVAFNPEFEYCGVRVDGQGYIVATALLESVAQKCGWNDPVITARFPGRAIEGRKARHPYLDRESLLVLADYVTLDQGTGCVHTAPGHGYDDYVTGVRYGLDILCPVDDDGRFTEQVEYVGGLEVFHANPKIIELLRARRRLLHIEDFQHAYPHCWRCHNPVIFRATPQWFIALDADGYRARVLEAIKRVRWIPAWGEERITNMVKDRPDWCISRQRDWGVPIVAFYCAGCGEILLERRVIDHVAGIFEREGADAWYVREVSNLLPAGIACRKCGGSDFGKEFDILDVWFDSGSSHLATLGRRDNLPWPSDLYIEGGDQYRGWFQSSLLIGVALRGESPYRTSITHGWTLDELGRAMSKSKGIGIDPDELIKQRGAEIARLLISSVNYVEDVRIFDELLENLSTAYRKIRNTCRFMLGNLSNQLDGARPRFDPEQDSVPFDEMLEIDRWAVARTNQVIQKCLEGYQEYQFHQVYGALYNFCVVDLSAFYLNILKDRLYTHSVRAVTRRSAQTALWYILDSFARLLAPILSFTAEEVWQAMEVGEGSRPSVHVQLFPVHVERNRQPELLEEWEKLRNLREIVSQALEEARRAKTIADSLEAKLVLRAGPEMAALLRRHDSDLRYLFIVSAVELHDSPERKPGDLKVEVLPAPGEKCERCWNYSVEVGKNAQFPTLCERCVPVVQEMEAGNG